jgi:F-type H+-transporting ATPase subunit a|tara:strand:- start:146 stop:1060 length:915 start_codon:yes stop_codon:yes gene_type:complete
MIHLLASENPIGHVVDQKLDWIHGSLTMHMVTLVVAGLIGLAVLLRAASAIKTGPEDLAADRHLTKGYLSQLVEVISMYLIENAIRPILGKDTDRFLPFLLSLFFFILTCNLLGLIPMLDLQYAFTGFNASEERRMLFGGTATANLAVTLGLALLSFIAIQYQGFRSLGVKGWMSHLSGGAPLYLLPIMLPVELLGLFIKPVALAIRLFANMVAGHTLLAVIASFGTMAMMATENWLTSGSISILAIIAAVPISFLELFVAFLQAFIFMFLTTVFIGQMTHHHEEHEEHEEHDEPHVPEGVLAH